MRIKKEFISFVGLCLFVVTSNPSLGQIVYGPPVRTMDVKLYYMIHVESVRDVNFKNLWYDSKRSNTNTAFQLRNGKYSGDKPRGLGGDEIELVDLYYFRTAKTVPESALVKIYWTSCGGSCSEECYLLLFRIDGEGLVETQQLDFDMQAEGAGTDFDPATRILTIRARTNDDRAHCCPKSIDVVKFKWTGTRFAQFSDETVPVKGR